jgi:hypothetical protein
MNRILSTASAGILGAAGVLSAAAAFTTISMTTAAPAIADTGCVPDIVCDVIDEANALPNSIAAQPGQFLVGDGTDDHIGLVNQPQHFADNLAGQPARFADTANPVNQVNRFLTGTCDQNIPDDCDFDDGDYTGILGQPQRFADNLAGQPQRFADSVARHFGAFGPDEGPDGDDGAGGTG